MVRVTDELPRFIGLPLTWVLWLMKAFVIFSGALMAVTFCLVVIIRYGFGGDLFAYEEWLLAISLVGFFAGAVLASERKLHINADILDMVITDKRWLWRRDLLVQVIELLVIVFIVYACYVSLADDFSFPRLRATSALRIPFVSWRIAIAVAFGLMAVFSAAHLYVHIRTGLGLPLKSELAKEVNR